MIGRLAPENKSESQLSLSIQDGHEEGVTPIL